MSRRPRVTRSGHDRIGLLTRLPVPGRAKTRLAPALGPEGAAALHRELTEAVAAEALPLAATGEAAVEVWHDGGTRAEMRSWLGPLPRYRRQPNGDLGQRLRAVFEDAFRRGAGRVVVVGSDCPAMTADDLRSGLAALRAFDLVLGPAEDGGYWLVGLHAARARRAASSIFAGIPWGGPDVLARTLERAAAARLAVRLLDERADVDRPSDLPAWERRKEGGGRGRLSVVIPTLDEAPSITRTVRWCLAHGAAEVVVADGGSRDRTGELAAAAGAVVVEAPRGRASQMNSGAARASSELLLFLHADTMPPPGFPDAVRATLGRTGTVAGAFAYAAGGGGPLARVLTAGARARCGLTGHPYGDQGLFLRARTFRALGGFPEIPVMEDWELVRRLRRLGRVVVLAEPATTSARAFAERGLAVPTAVNLAVIACYRLGVPPGPLARARARLAARSVHARSRTGPP